jgi:hypothetical protein
LVGLLFSDATLQQPVLEALCNRFGPLDLVTEARPFTHTTYYHREMGPGLLRQMCSFLDPVPAEDLADIKLATNALEQRFMRADRRLANIDPGLLSEERLVLATGKNYTHRIYLRCGIYADLTLIYVKGAYQPLPWTYPDYREPYLLHLLAFLRLKLKYQHDRRLPRLHRA